MSERDVYAKTVFAETIGEPEQGQLWVAWVIKNRARINKLCWGGGKIKNVCKHPGQFRCWDNNVEVDLTGRLEAYKRVKKMTDRVYDEPHHKDPTGGADHFHNPDIEENPEWLESCIRIRNIANLVFYKSKNP